MPRVALERCLVFVRGDRSIHPVEMFTMPPEEGARSLASHRNLA